MKITNYFYPLATLGPIGFFPIPGTMATIVSLPIMYCFYTYIQNIFIQGACLIVFCFLSWYCIHQIIHRFEQSDPKEIVLDEVIGTLITFFLVPITSFSLIAGFILFRFFDISKLCGVSYCEAFDGASGILCDDIVAALLANIVLHIILFFYY